MNTEAPCTIGVIGAGSWGTALAMQLARNGHTTLLWGRNAEQMAQMRDQRCNPRYLPDLAFPPALQVEADLKVLLQRCERLLVVVPSHVFRQSLEAIHTYWNPTLPVAWATKGLEQDSHKLLHQVAQETLGTDRALAVVSGPTFAREIAMGLPAAITVASNQPETAEDYAALLHGANLRVYTSDDIIGVELGGAAKNVLAIAAGIADGLGFGANTRAALITRGLHELMQLGVKLGGKPATFMGLAGMGDLVLTCTDDQSRNRRLGLALGRGGSQEKAMEDIGQVVEGVGTARILVELARSLDIELPICEQVYAVLYEGKSPRDAVQSLLTREQKAEF